MKKLLFTSAVLACTLLSAQIDLRSTRFGLVAGPNYSRVQNAHNSSGPKYGFFAGAVALIPIDNNNQFYLQPELLYVSAGETGDRDYEKLRNLPEATYGASFISIPINFKGYFSEAESEFFGFAGPRFDFLISQEVTNPSKASYEADSFGKAGSFNFNLGLGVGYSYRRQVELFFKYDIGLSNAFPDLKNSPEEIKTNDPNVAKKKSQQVMSLGLSYIFQ